MSIKVSGGTRRDVHVCPGCEHATVMQGSTESADRTYCSVIEGIVKGQITNCSTFSQRDNRMHRIKMFGGEAWESVKDDNGVVFFMPPDLGYEQQRAYLKKRKATVRSASRVVAKRRKK